MSRCPDADSWFLMMRAAGSALGIPLPPIVAQRWESYDCTEREEIMLTPSTLTLYTVELIELRRALRKISLHDVANEVSREIKRLF